MLIDQYFKHIADLATTAVAQSEPGVATPAVIDGPQEPRATAWASRSVHPLQFLETAYMAAVQKAVEAAGNDSDKARENEFAAMSEYFTLSATEPSLLLPATEPLIDTRCLALKAQIGQIRAMLAAGAAGVYANLVETVGDALATLWRMTTTTSLPDAAQDTRDAASYAGLFPNAPAVALAAWKNSHPEIPASLPQLVDEVDAKLVRPILSNATAVASPFSLYNIEAFYLFRLMHRFIGGNAELPMNVTQKGIASGAATSVMHLATATWLSNWHETQIQSLDAELRTLGLQLQQSFVCAAPPIRFYLKGGRAMNFCLGTPGAGTNDWDTGILIDPGLLPDQWYQAFSAVNDLVVHFLDRARFAYTEVLNKNQANLVTHLMQAPLAVVDQDDMPEFTRVALQAEHLGEQMSAFGAPQSLGLLGAKPGHRATGVNGELIDIGISTRSSVELAEHWDHLTIVPKAGVTGAMIPVPELAYFVDDFSTMIREAIATDMVGRKLAKRLGRLNQVLESNDPTFLLAIADHQSTVTKNLPLTYAALRCDLTMAQGRLQVWLLGALITSVPGYLLSETWLTTFDQYIASNVARLFATASVATFWAKLAGEFKTVADAAQAESLLVIENAVSELSHIVLKDARNIAAAIGNPGQMTPLWPQVKAYLDAIQALQSQPNVPEVFHVTTGFATQLHALHAKVPAGDLTGSCVSGAVEICCEAANPPQVNHFLQLTATMLGSMKLPGYFVAYDQVNHIVRISTNQVIAGLTISTGQTTLVIFREATAIESTEKVDFVFGWPIEPARSLIRQFTANAANNADYDIRVANKGTAQFLLKSVLGRQIS